MLRRYRFDYVHDVGSLVAALQGGRNLLARRTAWRMEQWAKGTAVVG
jgi:hypothetical protein